MELPRTQKLWKEEKENAKSRGWVWYLIVLIIGVMVITASSFTLVRYLNSIEKSSGHHHHGGISKKYGDALEVALLFFDVQKSGELVDNRIEWRGDSGVEDGREAAVDLSKGMYDAGDLIKFGFPMAFTATILSWSILEYGTQMDAVNQLDYALNSLNWITDYLINAHPSPNTLYIQVGDPESDHNCWVRPERMAEKRPVWQVNASFPGTDIAAETAAALASASIVFKTINASYSTSLLNHAQQLFTFADTYRGRYSVSVAKLQAYYNSTGYGDELLWAAAWLYFATSDEFYLYYATEINGQEFGNWGFPTWFTWDDKHAGAQVLLSRINMLGAAKGIPVNENLELQMYRQTAEEFMCMLLPDSPTASSSRTPSGLIWVDKWNALQYSMASAFLALLFSDYMASSQTSTLYCNGKLYTPADLRNFAISQADYVLGENPREMSYVVGYGMDYPQYVHHRGSSIPVDANTGCKDGFMWLFSPDPNPNVAFGALVGGPSFDETFKDTKTNRNNTSQAEPTTYNSAFLVGLLSGLVSDSFRLGSFT